MSQGGAFPDTPKPAPSADLAALARGGRINFFGFVLRLLARLPFLFIAGRIYGAEALGRFAYAVLIVEFAAQLATLGSEARARPAIGQDRPRPCPCGVGRAAGRRDRLGRGDGAARQPAADHVPQQRGHRARMDAADHGDRARLVGHQPRRARLSQQCRRDGARARDRRTVDDHHRRLRLVVHLDPRRADHRLCAVDDRRADRLDDPVPQKLWPAAPLEPAPGCLVEDGAAQFAGRRRRRGRMGLAPNRHRRARPVLFAARWSASIMSRSRSPRCRPSSRPASTRSSAR